MKNEIKISNKWINGFGIVKDDNNKDIIVYMPIWDPAPMNVNQKAFLTVTVINSCLEHITNVKIKEILTDIKKVNLKIVAQTYGKPSFEDPCPTPSPHYYPHRNNEIELVESALGEAMSLNIKIKTELFLLGKAAKNEAIIEAANMISFS